MAISTHNKYVSIPDWFSSSSSTPVTTVEKPTNVTNVYYGGGGGTTGITEIPIDNKTVVWLDLVITIPIDNDKIIINAEGKITTSDVYDTLKIWELRQLTDGTNYVYTTYPIVTQLGITMYAGTDGLNLGNIYDGLPIDGVTLYWSYDSEGNKILKSAGSVDGEGGVSDFWALHNIPSWITVSKPYYTTSEISEGNNLYFTNERAVSALAETLKYYVTLGDTQTITGEKNFTGGLKVNGSPIYYDTDKKYWKLEGDLLVTGGVTMYGSDSSFTPSTIMDAILYDDTTLGINSNGQLYVKGGTSGGGLDITALQNYLTQNSYLNVTSGDNRYLKLSGGTLSSDSRSPLTLKSGISENHSLLLFNRGSDYWGSIGFNDANSLIFKDTNGANYIIWNGSNDGSGSGLDADLLDGQQGSWYQGNIHSFARINYTSSLVHDANVAINGMLYNYGSNTYWRNTPDMSYGQILTLKSYGNNELMGQLAWDIRHGENDTTRYLWWRAIQDESTISNAKWHQIAFTDSNVASATKLQTARTIWGQSFDGTGNVSGTLSISSGANSGDTWASDLGQLQIYQGEYAVNQYSIGISANTSGYSEIQAASRGIGAIPLILQKKGGNVGIGTTSPQQKLHIEGHVWANGDIAAKTKIQSFGNLIVNGNVGIGTESPSSKLDVYNNTGTTVGLAIDGGLSAYGYLYNEIIIKHNGVFKASFGANSVASAYISGGAVGTYMNNSVSGEFISLLNEGGTYIKGNLLATGGITMYSDQRKKTILNHVELSLKQIANAPLIEHYYNSDEKKTTHVGSIAQYWASMNDWFCKLDSEGYYTMEIQNAALASAISIARELDRYESKTDKTIKKLKKRICELEEEIERLKSV